MGSRLETGARSPATRTSPRDGAVDIVHVDVYYPRVTEPSPATAAPDTVLAVARDLAIAFHVGTPRRRQPRPRPDPRPDPPALPPGPRRPAADGPHRRDVRPQLDRLDRLRRARRAPRPRRPPPPVRRPARRRVRADRRRPTDSSTAGRASGSRSSATGLASPRAARARDDAKLLRRMVDRQQRAAASHDRAPAHLPPPVRPAARARRRAAGRPGHRDAVPARAQRRHHQQRGHDGRHRLHPARPAASCWRSRASSWSARSSRSTGARRPAWRSGATSAARSSARSRASPRPNSTGSARRRSSPATPTTSSRSR